MEAGNYDKLIKLLQPTLSRNTAGETTATYPTGDALAAIESTWARVFAKTAFEQVRNGLTSAAVPYTVRIRWRGDVDEKWRILYDGRVLEISSAVEVGRREELDIVATELRE